MLRRSPRALALRVAAAAVAVITAGVVASDLAALHRRAHALGPERGALVATRDLTVGDMIEPSDVRTRQVHRSQVPDAVVAGPARAIGRVLTAPVFRGAYVYARGLAPRHRTGLDGIVPRGMRAIRVTVTGALRPHAGTAVDVLASFDASASDATGSASTVVVAAGVLVLGTDSHTSGSTGRGDSIGVTLLVDRDEAERLADAQAAGVLTVALVPPEEAASMPDARRKRS